MTTTAPTWTRLFSAGIPRIKFANDDGDWTIWEQFQTFADGNFVGPGYISRYARAGQIQMDDTASARRPINDPRDGGFGCFGWQHARADGDPSIYNEAWDITGRTDAAANGGFGVTGSTPDGDPVADANGNLHYGIAVVFGDGWQSDMVEVHYAWTVKPSCIEAAIAVTEKWDGSGYQAYAKEPKIVCHGLGAEVAGGLVYTWLDVFDSASNRLEHFNLTTLPDPTARTHQIGYAGRMRARFGDGSGAQPYFNFVAEGIDGGGAHTVWQDGAHGLDGWAALSDGRAEFASSPCGAYCLQGAGGGNAGHLTRRWESAHWTTHPQVGVMFHGWEGGSGPYDCMCASRQFGRSGESWSVYLCISHDVGWET